MYKLIYKEYGEEIIVTSTDEDPLCILLRQLFLDQGERLELIFYGKKEKNQKEKKNEQ